MNILIVHNKYQIPGGEDVVVENEAAMLKEHGHKVVLYIRNNSELSEGSRLKKGLMYLESFFSVKAYRDICRLIRKKKIDVVHVHNTVHRISPSVFYAAVHMGVPVVQTLHNFRMVCPGATLYRAGHICEECIGCSDAGGNHVAGSCSFGRSCRMRAGSCYLPAIQHACYRGSCLQTAAVVLSLQLQKLSGIWGKVHYICLTDFNKEKLLSLNSGSKKALIPASHIHVKPNFVPDMFTLDLRKTNSGILQKGFHNSCTGGSTTANLRSSTNECLTTNQYSGTAGRQTANHNPGAGASPVDDHHSDMIDRSAESGDPRTVGLLSVVGLTQDTKYYLSLGRLERIKGTHLIVKAFARNGKPLVMVGTGEQETEIKKYLEKHHITNIHLAGQLPHGDAMKLLAKAEALVICPQIYETFGMNVVEAFSLGIPVISNCIGNAAALVSDGVTGVKCENTIAGLCQAVDRFEELDRAELSSNARHAYEEKFSEEKNYEQLLSIYKKIGVPVLK